MHSGDCVRVCAGAGIGAISFAGRGPDTVVSTAFGNLADVNVLTAASAWSVHGGADAKPETDFV